MYLIFFTSYMALSWFYNNPYHIHNQNHPLMLYLLKPSAKPWDSPWPAGRCWKSVQHGQQRRTGGSDQEWIGGSGGVVELKTAPPPLKHQEGIFRYLKWRGFLKPKIFRLFFWGGNNFPLSRIHTASIGEDSSILTYMKCFWWCFYRGFRKCHRFFWGWKKYRWFCFQGRCKIRFSFKQIAYFEGGVKQYKKVWWFWGISLIMHCLGW